MNGIIKIVIVITIAAFIAGCSGASGENRATANANTSNPANSVTVSNANPGDLIPYPGTENSNGSPSNANVKVTNIDPQKIKPTNPAMPAADNSEITSTLNEKGGLDTRTFKSHPLLAKIERTTEGREVRLKVYLKNGKVIELPPGKIGNFANDSAAQILQAAGVQSPPPPVQNADTGAVTGKKTEETKESKPSSPAQTPNAPPGKVPLKP